MRILSVISSIDLEVGRGCTPAWWQLHKALHEEGHELIVTPYLGRDVGSLWWRTYENPCARESQIYHKISDWLDLAAGSDKGTSRLVRLLTNLWTKPKWETHLRKVLDVESPDAVLFFNVPINQISGIPSSLRETFDIPMLFFDGDMPTILPEHVESRGFKFNYYEGADLSEFDAFIVNSEGVIDRLLELGARDVFPVHYGADPGLYKPVDTEFEFDVAFFGSGAKFREEFTHNMIVGPSRHLPDLNFIVGGRGYDIDLGVVHRAGWVPFNGFREFCGQAKINLNITREGHRDIYKSSTSRPFELAAMGCCVVSDPYMGLEEWFDIGTEMFVVHNQQEAIETYEWLLDNEQERAAVGRRARNRVLEDHTFQHRAEEIIQVLSRYM